MVEHPPSALLKNPYVETTEDTVSLLFCSKCSRAYDGSETSDCLHVLVRRVVWRRPVDRTLVGRRFGTPEYTGRILTLIDGQYCVQRREIPPANTVNTQTFNQYMAASEILLVPASEVRNYTILPD